jgi:hypothetical protein
MTMQSQSPNLRFIAVVASPQPLRLYLTHTGIDRSSFGSLDWLGWKLVAIKVSETGEEQPIMDHWEETLLEILRYPEEYSDQSLDWRWEQSGDPANLHVLQPTTDESRRFKTAVKTAIGPNSDVRLCFNLYDDGGYRFTREGLIRERELSAWVPQEWSEAYKDLSSAEEAARKKFDWVN